MKKKKNINFQFNHDIPTCILCKIIIFETFEKKNINCDMHIFCTLELGGIPHFVRYNDFINNIIIGLVQYNCEWKENIF